MTFFTRYIQGNKAIILLKLYKLKNNLKLYYNLCIKKSWLSIDIYNLSYESIKTVYYFTQFNMLCHNKHLLNNKCLVGFITIYVIIQKKVTDKA